MATRCMCLLKIPLASRLTRLRSIEDTKWSIVSVIVKYMSRRSLKNEKPSVFFSSLFNRSMFSSDSTAALRAKPKK